MDSFSRSALVRQVSSDITGPGTKSRILCHLQPWSDAFQRVIAARVASESDKKLRDLAQEHMKEELGHNELLAKSRNGIDPPAWDPVIEAVSSWFIDQMTVLPGTLKAVLAHLVLEGSGMVFHQAGASAFKGNEYFALHDEADQEHLEMGYKVLEHRNDWEVGEVVELLKKGWTMITLLCNRVAELSSPARPSDPAIFQ
ncbi:hypothetical protein ACF08N_36675 [Streptomyces sp. NPDC015127]|uniref:hypothetical protein n=1 Tax=Streptomyces sp. NPDC015127 TaxID=3364939 RepID=UPI0036F9658C